MSLKSLFGAFCINSLSWPTQVHALQLTLLLLLIFWCVLSSVWMIRVSYLMKMTIMVVPSVSGYSHNFVWGWGCFHVQFKCRVLISPGVCFANLVLVTDIKLCYKKISDCVFFILCLFLPLNWIAFNLDWVSHYLLKSIHMKDANIFSVCSYSCCIVLELNMRVSLNTI